MKLSNITATTRLKRAEASTYLKRRHGLDVAVNTLNKYACTGAGPRFFRAGGITLYPVAELDAWANARVGDLVG